MLARWSRSRSCGLFSTARWRAVLDDLIKRGLRRREFLVVDGAPGLDKAIATVWDGVPVQRCTIHILRSCPKILRQVGREKMVIRSFLTDA